MSKHALVPKCKTYAELRRSVEEALVVGQRQIEEAKVQTYWRTGRLIHQHLLLHEDRADYGARVIRRLAADLQVHHTVLYRCLRFARAFPIVAARRQLSWAHYRALTRVEDEAERKNLEMEAAENRWTSRQLELRVKPIPRIADCAASVDLAKGSVDSRLLTPKRGTPGIYRLTQNGDPLTLDLGFTSYIDLSEEQAGGLKPGDFVRLDAKGKLHNAAEAGTGELYTYRAEVIRVVDGDTLWMKIYLRPRHWLKEKLRLRGIDCPELDTSAGKAARRFVETLLARAGALTITTTKPDKYDRYLSDLFLEMDSGEEIFLNNALLQHGHATRKESVALEDWN